MDKFLEIAYALSWATTQAISSFAQVRAQQVAIKQMTDVEIQQFAGQAPVKAPIGFTS